MKLRNSPRSRPSGSSGHGARRLPALAAVTVMVAVMLASSGSFTSQAAPSSPSAGAPYRHGVVPKLGATPQRSAAAPAAATTLLLYGGGNSGVGVTTGPPKVYVVFWGSQWGTASTNGQGYTTLSGDPNGMAPKLQAFIKGLGTGNETWSGVMTQYCEGVASGATSCPANSAHVGYPSGGALAGVWVDPSATLSTATGGQLAQEAVTAAGHFGNTTPALNRNAQYFIVSPTGTHPDGFNSTANWCAWHDFSADPSLPGGAVSSPYGAVAFTNMPYITDAGSSCGQNFVNTGSAGTLDGATIVGGHEYAETITDQFPNGGWLDSAAE